MESTNLYKRFKTVSGKRYVATLIVVAQVIGGRWPEGFQNRKR